MPDEAKPVIRAFEQALLLAPLSAKLVRQRQGRTVEKLVKCLYDHLTGVFKVAVENTVEKGDHLQLEDGRIFDVEAVRPKVVDGVRCYLEIAARPADTWRDDPPPSGVRNALTRTPAPTPRAGASFGNSSGSWRFPYNGPDAQAPRPPKRVTTKKLKQDNPSKSGRRERDGGKRDKK